MKRWAVLTVLLYALALIAADRAGRSASPLATGAKTKQRHRIARRSADFYLNWGYWLWLAVLVAGQFLAASAAHQYRRTPPARAPAAENSRHRHRVLSGQSRSSPEFFQSLCAIFTDKAFDYFDLFALFDLGAGIKTARTANSSTGRWRSPCILTVVVVFWIIWAFIFRRSAKIRRTRRAPQTRHPLAPARQHPRTARRRAQPRHRPPPRRLLRARRHVLGHRHRHFRHAALLRPRRFLPVRRTLPEIEAKQLLMIPNSSLRNQNKFPLLLSRAAL